MDIIERLRTDLREARLSQLEVLADEMGIPRGTFIKIVNGQTPNPRWRTVKAIQAYYDRLPASLVLAAVAPLVAHKREVA